MPVSVRLSDEIVSNAKTMASIMNRSSAGQIEYWAKIGKIAEENPDLPYSFIKQSLIAKAEMDNSEVSEYKFDD
jgi:hypothetical protein